MDPPPEPPKTPPNKFPLPPTPRAKTPPPRISCNINERDEQGPFYFECRNDPPDFEVPPLKGNDFKERLTVEEGADKLGYKLPSGESLLSGRPDPSELKPGSKLPPSIAELDRLLKKGNEAPMSRSRRTLTSGLKSNPADFLGSAKEPQEADQKYPKLLPENSSKSTAGLGLMLPPPIKESRGLQKKPDKHILNPPPGMSLVAKQGNGAMPQRLLKGADRLQEMSDIDNPMEAEEQRARVFMHHLPHAQAASRRLQSHLDIYADETWPLPLLPSDHNLFLIETNAIKIRTALEDCKDFAVTTNRESAKLEFLDVAAKHATKRVVVPAGQAPQIRAKSFEEEKKASEAEESVAVTHTADEGLQEDLKGLEDEGMSELPSTPKPLSHSVGPSRSPTAPQVSEGSSTAAIETAAIQDEDLPPTSQGGSSVDTAERERREEWEELSKDPRFIGIGPYGWPEYNGPATTDSADRSNASGATPEWVYRENATPNPHYDSEGNSIPYNSPTVSNDDREMRTISDKIETASAASGHTPAAAAPPSEELQSLSIHDSEVEGMSSVIDEGRETSPAIGVTNLVGPRVQDEGEGQEKSSSVEDKSLYTSQAEDEKDKQTISGLRNSYMDDGQQRHGRTTGIGGKLDVAASLRNHSVTLVDETQPKAKERNPPVPQPSSMPNTLTEAICNYIPLEAKPILTLTLERVDPPVPSPTDQPCIQLKHFEVGLDGVEGLCQGTAKIPETEEITAERERRVGKIGTFKDGDGGFHRVLKSTQQKEQQYGKGYWYFFGVKFKQTSKEKKLRRGGKWLLFGAPIEAVYRLDIKKNQENVTILLGGGADKSGTTIEPFKANFKRTHTLFSRGGVAPMDIWPGGEDWDDGVFKEIRVAMANNGLRVGFLYADTETFSPIPKSFPAAGKLQTEKKRKQSGPEMTEEEMKAMEKRMKPKKLSDEDIGTIFAMKAINDRAKQDAAARSK